MTSIYSKLQQCNWVNAKLNILFCSKFCLLSKTLGVIFPVDGVTAPANTPYQRMNVLIFDSKFDFDFYEVGEVSATFLSMFQEIYFMI